MIAATVWVMGLLFMKPDSRGGATYIVETAVYSSETACMAAAMRYVTGMAKQDPEMVLQPGSTPCAEEKVQ